MTPKTLSFDFHGATSVSRLPLMIRDKMIRDNRFSDPATRFRARSMDTERAAAVVAVDRLTEKQSTVLQTLRELTRTEKGATDERLTQECARAFGWHSGSTARTRRSELVQLGFATDSGERRPIATGNTAAVWIAL